jgi:hypothetical protein
MGLFNKIFGSQKKTAADVFVAQIAELGNLLYEERSASNEALFEVLLFSTVHVLNVYKMRYPASYSQFQKDYFIGLEKWANEKGVYRKIKGSYSDFVNSRFELYFGEFTSWLDNPHLIRTKTAFHFYEKPLEIKSGDCMDLFLIMRMTGATTELINRIDSIIDEVATNYR